MQEQDLSLVSFDELIAELHKRFDNWIFSGMQVRNEGHDGKGKILTLRKWGGNSATCAGLASQMQIAIYDVYIEKNEEADDNEPFEQ